MNTKKVAIKLTLVNKNIYKKIIECTNLLKKNTNLAINFETTKQPHLRRPIFSLN